MIKRINVFKKERRQSMSDNPEEGSYKEEEKPEWFALFFFGFIASVICIVGLSLGLVDHMKSNGTLDLHTAMSVARVENHHYDHHADEKNTVVVSATADGTATIMVKWDNTIHAYTFDRTWVGKITAHHTVDVIVKANDSSVKSVSCSAQMNGHLIAHSHGTSTTEIHITRDQLLHD